MSGPTEGARGVDGGKDQLGRDSALELTPIEDNPIWQQDNVTLYSVGVDVGSSGTQVMFSRLHLRRMGEKLTSRYVVIRRESIYQSPVQLTPYSSRDLIDAEALGEIVDDAYRAAGITPSRIDTGVVILTGEALRRRNAERITRTLAELGGDFVCATAGHNMEAMLAAYGSGAAKESYDRGLRLLNVDMGGGTTKLALVEGGQVLGTAAIHVGGRLVVVGENGEIERLDPAGRSHAARVGLTWELGTPVGPEQLAAVAESMADVLLEAIAAPPLRQDIAGFHLTAPIGALGRLDGVRFSGGVAEYIYEREQRDLGDLGPFLGAALRARVGRFPAELLPPGECIRATVLGASQYSVQLSGNTCAISDADRLLPRRDLQVIRPRYESAEDIDPAEVAGAIKAHLAAFDVDRAEEGIALALGWSGLPTHRRLARLAAGIVDGLADRIALGHPLYLVLDGDVALTLGEILRTEVKVEADLIILDGLALRDFDYVDLGRVRQPSGTVPVTIKSLVFGAIDGTAESQA